MPLIILFIAIVFTFSAFLANLQLDGTENSFFNFIYSQADFISNHQTFFLILFLVAVVIFLRIVKFEATHKIHHKALISFAHVTVLFFIGISLSYIFLLIIAWAQLNIYALMIDANPASLGIISDQKTIIQSIKNTAYPLQIIASDNDTHKELVAITSAITGKNNFYGSSALGAVPSFLVLPIGSLGSSILVDNTIIITKIDNKNLQTLSPVIGYMFIQHYFPNRQIKSFPKVYFMDEKEFEAYRVQDKKDKLAQIAHNLSLIEENISSLSATITNDKKTIANDQATIQTSYQQKDKQASACYAIGAYDKNGIFEHQHTESYCNDQVKSLLDKAVNAQQEIDTLTQNSGKNKTQLALLKTYDNFFKIQQQTLKTQKVNPSELGVFKPPDEIRVVIDTTNSHAVADYFESVVHEYLHYVSYNPKKSFNILFFEEGFTEYFARAAIKDNLNIDTNNGYPIFVKIIAQMTNRIAETDLADIYFTKDETKLEQTLDSVYGDNFYKDNALLFTTLQYATTPQQIIGTANKIMQKIGGSNLNEKDLYSTESVLN